jgi:hypothetical protein
MIAMFACTAYSLRGTLESIQDSMLSEGSGRVLAMLAATPL